MRSLGAGTDVFLQTIEDAVAATADR